MLPIIVIGSMARSHWLLLVVPLGFGRLRKSSKVSFKENDDRETTETHCEEPLHVSFVPLALGDHGTRNLHDSESQSG